MTNVLTRQPILRRCDVVDADFRVIMRGPAADQLQPVAGETLEPEFGRELALVISLHDFKRHPIATALVGTEYGLRIACLPGVCAQYYTVAIERVGLGRSLRAAAALYHLPAGEQELLRLLVGGYDERAIGKRLESSTAGLKRRIRALRAKLGCARRSDLVALVFATPTAEDTTVRLHA